ncbi:hypothetical protein C2S52_001846 [Perilla frutescens var. hirtella]|uniref:Ubiquitin-like protease family profile domain-containing protein n=1 Tax=Perilla frutescens var. hirtella TaxID=608512 RepID=A0AAD4PG47_PERFH|nr:hypothetical protein C2S52_001846 [Perilla frutescens var. hirtella]KAH6837820.1 hypothetical protein C2S53_013980 [Perilla frutescens var. hirtella]
MCKCLMTCMPHFLNSCSGIMMVSRIESIIPRFPIPALWSFGVCKSWFDIILNPEGWLSAAHMDAILALIVIRCWLKNHGKSHHLCRWSILDTTCWGVLTQADPDILYEHILPYVQGARPAVGANRWEDVDKVYGLGLVREAHWLCYEISIKFQRITVYDSLSSSDHWPSLTAELKCFAENIPRYKHAPQQLNEGDCGVLDLKYMECLLNGSSVNGVSPKRTCEYRRNFCAELFQYGMNMLAHGFGE